MPYTKQDLKKLNLDETKPIDSYPIVKLNVFDNIDDIKLNEKVRDVMIK